MQLDGKTVLVTGATDGIGLQTALALARLGARVLVHGRSQSRVDAALRVVGREGAAEGLVADFESLAQVRSLGEEVARRDRLDVLVNNAGIFLRERRLTRDGLEATFQVNHLAHFLLTHRLLELLGRSAPSRIVNVSSMVHRGATLDLDDLRGERGWSGYSAYGASKLANILFTVELARRLADQRVTANALHPGVVGTKVLRASFGGIGSLPPVDGAKTSVWLASDPALERVSGRYFDDCREAAATREANDPALARRLWEVSAGLTRLA